MAKRRWFESAVRRRGNAGRTAARLVEEKDALVWNLYGPTETTIWSTAQQIESGSAITIGRPIANTQIYILDKFHEPVPVGVAGELMIGGDESSARLSVTSGVDGREVHPRLLQRTNGRVCIALAIWRAICRMETSSSWGGWTIR